MLHDERRYPEPDTFNPSRFLTADGKLDPSVPDPVEAFGHGRRICPGRHFAADNVWLLYANVLAAFIIEKPVDGSGNTVEPTGEYTPGMFRYEPHGFDEPILLSAEWPSFPLPFKADIRPRSSAYTRLVAG